MRVVVVLPSKHCAAEPAWIVPVEIAVPPVATFEPPDVVRIWISVRPVNVPPLFRRQESRQ
jgi:hypothetical protein